MCGIFAVISKKYHKEAQTIFKQMLYVGALRGWDGAGLFRVHHQGVAVMKKPGPSSNLIQHINKPPISSLFGDILVGHNRAATRGINTENNTHPFQEKHITLVHNGTIWGHRQLADVDVDSHAICHYLTEHTPQELVNTLSGAYTLVWYDTILEELRFIRNDERPLYIIHTEDLTVLASEHMMAQWILTRNGVKVHNVEEITPYTLYSISKKELHTINKQPLKEPAKNVIPFAQNKKKEEEIKKEEVKKKDKILPITKTTQSILDYLESKGLKKNQRFTAYCYDSEQLGTSYKNFAIADFDMTEEVVFYAKDPYEGAHISLTFGSLMDDPTNNSYLLFGHTVQEVAEQDEVKVSTNGVRITKEVNQFLQGRNCSTCKTPYTYTTVEHSHITELGKNGDKVAAYSYCCPECTDFIEANNFEYA